MYPYSRLFTRYRYIDLAGRRVCADHHRPHGRCARALHCAWRRVCSYDAHLALASAVSFSVSEFSVELLSVLLCCMPYVDILEL